MSVNKKYKCRLCKECNGKACIGELPGMGGVFESSNFILNWAISPRIFLFTPHISLN